MHNTNTFEKSLVLSAHRNRRTTCNTVAALVLTSGLISACNTVEHDSIAGNSQSEHLAADHATDAVTSDPQHLHAESAIAQQSLTTARHYGRQQAADANQLAIVPQPAFTTIESAQLSADYSAPPTPSREKYAAFDDNKTVSTLDQPVSTFSIDVDTGSYANVRRFLDNGQLPPADAVRIEEMLNYFSYRYSQTGSPEQPFSVTTEVGPTPWNTNTHLLHIGLQGYTPDDLDEQAANLVFLIDVSGSMNSPEKLGLLKSAMSLMTQQLDEKDTVSIVVYAGSSGVVLEPTPGNQQHTIDRALAHLQAGGSTNGVQGITLAYDIAMDNFIENGTNRIILATDGDFNVGISNTETLVELIKEKRQSGVALTTLGLGMGNYNDHLMEQLADAGNGNYAYIDTLGEARKVLVDELAATLLTIAKDVKIQIEFNPTTVSEYRLIGYTNRILANEDFSNDKVDAGEIGAGHSVTALYEVALKGNNGERHTPRRYQPRSESDTTVKGGELAEIRLRFKLPDSEQSELISTVIELDSVVDNLDNTSNAYRFAASVAGFGQLLRGDNRLNEFGFDTARNLANETTQDDPFGYRAEYLRLLDLANSLDSLKRAQTTPAPRTRG